MEQTRPKLKTNLDTNLLKLVAVVSMLTTSAGPFLSRSLPFAGRAGWRFRCSDIV